MNRAYYNEIDPYAARWLERLIDAGHIAPGDVDTRSIVDVTPSDLAGYTQCHFFAGIGVWSYALRLAGWNDERPVWTGSCPCQPFSQAGKGGGIADERHLWPYWHHLISVCKPGVIFGEQVASPAGLGWFDLVHADLEGAGYASGAVDLCAAGVGAPHIRQRLYFVADFGLSERGPLDSARGRISRGNAVLQGQEVTSIVGKQSANGELADTDGRNASAERLQRSGQHGLEPQDAGAGLGLGNNNTGLEGRRVSGGRCSRERTAWTPSDFIWCRDGKWRPVEPGTFPLAHGATARVGRLRAYGNAIVAPCAQAFIESYLNA